MHQQERLDADEEDQHRGDHRDPEIGQHGREPRPPAVAHQADRQPVLQHEHVDRAEPEHHQRMAVEAIAQPPDHGSARYSPTVSVSMSPMPRRPRLPDDA